MTYDAIVLGAGINGCGIARELAERGQRVLVLDKGAIGGGTSSKSSRLIHGGLRYLETRQFGLVREALSDRLELLGRYPELVSMRPFYLPIYRKSPRPVWRLWTGIKLYDALAGRHNIYRSRKISRKRFTREFPALKQEGIRAVLRYDFINPRSRCIDQGVTAVFFFFNYYLKPTFIPGHLLNVNPFAK